MAEFELEINGVTKRVRIDAKDAGYEVQIDDRVMQVDAKRVTPNVLSILDGNRSLTAHVARDGDDRHLSLGGPAYVMTSGTSSRSGGGDRGGVVSDGKITTPMPGKVVRVEVAGGAEVTEGQTLVIVEAMKMEHELRAPFAGRVSAVHFSDGDTVQFGDVLVEVEAAD